MRRRRAIIVFIVGLVTLVLFGGALPGIIEEAIPAPTSSITAEPDKGTVISADSAETLAELDTLVVKGRAPKVGYERAEFGDGWSMVDGCSTRNIILYRDFQDPVLDGACAVIGGTLQDPYSGEAIIFSKEDTSAVQIDHIVALSDAWQKGAQQLTYEQRKQLANDPLELLAVSGAQNQAKSDGDAATWLPKNKSFRCDYIARQIAIKKKYSLWVTEAEKNAMKQVLTACSS